MTLLFDRRAELNGPGVHALIAGVGWYPNESLISPLQLTSVGPTTRRVHDWLIANQSRLPLPLATVRMLLSEGPSPAPDIERCTLQNLLRAASEWRRDASGDRSNVTWLYLVGYGLELEREQLFLLEDFGDGIGPLLRNAVNVNNILNGMSPAASDSGIARTQWYFLDLGRSRPDLSIEQWRNASRLFDEVLSGLDDREAGVFYSSESGESGYAVPGGYTLFADALLQCLDGAEGAAVMDDNGRWCVRSMSLADALQTALMRRTENLGVTQRVVVGGSIRNGILCYLDGPPQLELRIRFDRPVAGRIVIADSADEPILEANVASGSTETVVRLLAGLYRVTFIAEDSRTANQFVAVAKPMTLQMRVPS